MGRLRLYHFNRATDPLDQSTQSKPWLLHKKYLKTRTLQDV